MSRLGGGVFRELIHAIPNNADHMHLNGVTYWWSTCQAVCIPLPDEPTGHWPPRCETCFPNSQEQPHDA